MAKRLQLTAEMQSAIRRVSGNEDIDFSKIVAYESVAASTRAISQKNSPYDGAMMTETYLREMSAALLASSVTLQVMHNNQVLPIGQVFMADVFSADSGHFDLNAAFYLEADSEYVQKLDLGIIGEVSVGTLPKHAYCSQCDFDYMQAPWALFWRECENEHQIGVDGVHLRLTNMASWNELSLVNRGASSKPKILGTAQQRLGKETYQRLAASNTNFDLSYLACGVTPSSTPNNVTGESMDKQTLELAQSVGRLESEKGQLEASMATLKTQLESANSQNAQLKTELEAAKSASPADLESTKSELAAVTAFLTEQYQHAVIAAELTAKDAPTIQEMMEGLREANVKLAAIPRGGVTKPSGSETTVAAPDYSLAAAYVNR